jgi:hypothetical protein
MDNTHLPPGGDENANRPTEQFWSEPGQPGHPGPGSGGPRSSGPGGPVQDGPGYREPGRGGAGYGGPADGESRYGQPGYGGAGYGQPWPGGGPGFHPQPGGEPLGQHYARDRRKALHWSVGLALVALLAGGGAIVGVSLAGSPSPMTPAGAPSAAAGPAAAAGPTGQAAVLNAALSSADTPAAPAYLDSAGAVAGAAAGTVASGPGAAGASASTPARRCARARAAARVAGRPRLARRIRLFCRHPLLRALALRGVEGQFTFRAKNGFKTLAFERGTIQSVSSGRSIVVRSPDGTTWTWDLVSSTVVRESGQKTPASALAAGEQVWTGGPVTGGAKDSRLIVIRPASATPSPSSSPAGS